MMTLNKIGATQIPSEEATENQLELARRQGNALRSALDVMIGEVADDGQEIEHGPYLIGYAIEDAEGMYHRDDDGNLVWQEPGKENIHVEISVRDKADGRFIPYLDIHARLIDSEGKDVGLHRQPFVWHPWLYHYGRNWFIENGGDYTLEVRIKAPDFPRHDKKNGKRYSDDVEVTFSAVKIDSQ
jgi:hypothetical protein